MSDGILHHCSAGRYGRNLPSSALSAVSVLSTMAGLEVVWRGLLAWLGEYT
jgi:hypothetical protein